VVAVLVCSVLSAGAAPSGPEALPASFASAWNSHSAQAFEKLFTEDADLVAVYDTRDDGRSKIVSDLKDTHEGWAKDTTVTVSKMVVRLVRPDVAVIHFNAELTWPGDEFPPAGRTMLFVAVREAGGWKISSAQVTKPNCPE
jgi:uncharacterized protein (TIGR02246 family)